MGRTYIRSGNEPIKYLMANNMAINFDMLGAFMKSRIVGKRLQLGFHNTWAWQHVLEN